MSWGGVIKAYKECLPVTEKTPILTLNEKNTPLLNAFYLSQLVGAEVYLKFEGTNPTGSFKGCGMVVVVARALE